MAACRMGMRPVMAARRMWVVGSSFLAASGQLRDSFRKLLGSSLPTGASVICRFVRSNLMAARHMGTAERYGRYEKSESMEV
jgi:hypothetical protein